MLNETYSKVKTVAFIVPTSKAEYKTEEFNRTLQEFAWKTVSEYAPSFVKASKQ
ncbi:MAG: hypothetical protein JW787_03070 [Sedimentisphaerales bacterium]|nr:hypothetical protein [Sedimentisphaerales bacterium]